MPRTDDIAAATAAVGMLTLGKFFPAECQEKLKDFLHHLTLGALFALEDMTDEYDLRLISDMDYSRPHYTPEG